MQSEMLAERLDVLEAKIEAHVDVMTALFLALRDAGFDMEAVLAWVEQFRDDRRAENRPPAWPQELERMVRELTGIMAITPGRRPTG
ncbi:hypothetical protein [Rhodoplanes roseus]|uniref:Uncharacterized protein n=1 Tax=Rhodoplanes roseus TaxID=29409 RepID=A0A327KSC8_9BRAD|nr:hypothetical protein [Rhodoplanes roseus]RAI38278.1 hypothetical protein CH341_28165 [Rhodoplanes roseus]